MALAQPERTRPLRAGDLVGGKLKLRRDIGEGGMGAVWLALNIVTGADVAVKLLLPDRQREHAAERFRYEARLGATLAHRNICKVFDLLEEPDGTLVLVMDLLRGETLAAYAGSLGKLSNREAVATMIPVLSGLQHAHDHDIIHRDLKPTNIFLHVDPDGHVTPKLFDFGIAKIEASTVHTRTGDVLGTPAFMSPEQVRAQKLDARSDLFSAGVILYELITGENPFRAGTSAATLARVLEEEVDCHPAIEPKVWLEIQRAVSKERSNRHASASALADALCAAIGETSHNLAESLRREKPLPSSLSPSSPPPVGESQATATVRSVPLRPPVNRTWLAVGVGLACALVTAGVLRMRSEGPPPAGSAVPTEVPSTATNARVAPSDQPDPTADRPSPSAEVSLAAPPPSAKHASHKLVVRTKPAGSAKEIARTPGF